MAEEINEKAKAEDMTMSERVDDMMENAWSSSATSFSQLEATAATGDALDDLQSLIYIAEMLLENIRWNSPDKMAEAESLMTEFMQMCDALMAEYKSNTGSEAMKERNPGLVERAKNLIKSFKEKGKKRDKKTACKELSQNNNMMIWRTKEGGYRWFATYSNCFRDDDNPAEIISKESHIKYTEMVDKGIVDYPELWHWHVKGSAWGKADWICFDEETGMAMASGYVYEGHEKEAESLMNSKEEIGVSHGMPVDTIERNDPDQTVITGHITKEISDLPLWAAANKLTGFQVLKENEMAIPKQKEEYLKSHGVSDESIQNINQINAEKSKSAIEAGIESKENETATETPAETPETNVTETPVETDAQASKEETTVEVVTVQVLADAVKQITDAFANALKEVSDKVDAVTNSLESHVKESAEQPKEKEANNLTPTASLAAIISASMSAAKSKETTVRKNSELATSAPVETPAESAKPKVVSTGNPILDGALNDIVNGK